MEQIKTFKDKPEEETVKYIYEQIYNLSKNEDDNWMSYRKKPNSFGLCLSHGDENY